MGMMLVHKPIGLLVFLVFFFSLNSQLSSSSNATALPNNSPLMLCHPLQSHALLRFISTFTIDIDQAFYGCPARSYPKTESWKEGTDCCSSWEGITCDDVTGHVIGLDLSCSQLKGTIHSNNSLFSSHIAPHLHSLNLAYNNFTGSDISSEFWVKFGSSLTHLNLSESNFIGNISSEISHLSNLVSLDLSPFNFGDLRVESDRVLENIARNLTHLRVLHLDLVDMSSLHASSLINLSSSLTSLRLSNCELQGEFPVSFLVYPNLEELYLSYNNFNPVTSLPYLNSTSSNLLVLDLTNTTTFSLSSSIALLDFVGNYLKSLSHLDLSYCNISGSIPPSFGNLKFLRHLDLSYSNINELIPPSFGNLTQLTRLYLYENHLSGPIPPTLGNLIELTDLRLSFNNLSGPIPTSFSNLTHLTVLYLSDNDQLEGPLPSFLFDLPSLAIIDLSYNKLHGPFPSSLIKSMQLYYLDLSHNNISSSTPVDINHNYSLPNFKYLDLSSCNFNQFPAFIKALANLSFLHISNNQVQGPVPEWIYNVGKDTLTSIDFSGNLLTTVGSKIHWKNIQYIDLRSNLLQGSLPILPTTTRFFLASNNSLSGEVSSFCNLSSINLIDLSYNHFTGSIPQCLGRLSNLSVLNLGMNNLHGVIPNSFTKNSRLNYLVLGSNKFRGNLPRSLAYCQSLQILDVSNNMIKDTFPHWLESLPALKILVLRSNKFFGSFSSFKAKFSFSMLRILDLSNNTFTGGLPIRLIMNQNLTAKMDEKLGDGSSQYIDILSYEPDEYFVPLSETTRYGFDTYDLYRMVVTVKGLEMPYEKIMAALAIIDFSRNQFEGHIPDLIGKLVSLKGLNLSHNLLTGHIPSSMGDLVNLEWLDLSSNELTGNIPTKLADLTSLEVLNLSYNRLEGPIPQGKQFNTFGNDSYKENLALCGFPLSKSCGPNPESVDYEDKDLSDSEGGFSWEGAFAGYGCGIVFGLCIGYVMFKKRSPKWLVRMVEGKQQRGRDGKRRKRGGRRT